MDSWPIYRMKCAHSVANRLCNIETLNTKGNTALDHFQNMYEVLIYEHECGGGACKSHSYLGGS